MQALSVKGLCKNFGGLQVLQDISFSVETGERLAVIGPNGAGKTTLLNTISGELPPTAGNIYLFGQDISNEAVHRRVHLGLARSFQLNCLFPNLTLLDNVLLAFQGTRRSRFQMFRANSAYIELFAKAEALLQRSDDSGIGSPIRISLLPRLIYRYRGESVLESFPRKVSLPCR